MKYMGLSLGIPRHVLEPFEADVRAGRNFESTKIDFAAIEKRLGGAR